MIHASQQHVEFVGYAFTDRFQIDLNLLASCFDVMAGSRAMLASPASVGGDLQGKGNDGEHGMILAAACWQRWE